MEEDKKSLFSPPPPTFIGLLIMNLVSFLFADAGTQVIPYTLRDFSPEIMKSKYFARGKSSSLIHGKYFPAGSKTYCEV